MKQFINVFSVLVIAFAITTVNPINSEAAALGDCSQCDVLKSPARIAACVCPVANNNANGDTAEVQKPKKQRRVRKAKAQKPACEEGQLLLKSGECYTPELCEPVAETCVQDCSCSEAATATIMTKLNGMDQDGNGDLPWWIILLIVVSAFAGFAIGSVREMKKSSQREEKQRMDFFSKMAEKEVQLSKALDTIEAMKEEGSQKAKSAPAVTTQLPQPSIVPKAAPAVTPASDDDDDLGFLGEDDDDTMNDIPTVDANLPTVQATHPTECSLEPSEDLFAELPNPTKK